MGQAAESCCTGAAAQVERRIHAGLVAGVQLAPQRLDGQHSLLTSFNLSPRHAVGVGAIHSRQVNKVHIGQLTRIMHRAPSACDGVQMLRDDPFLDRLGKGFLEERREHVVLLPIRFNRPFAGGPILVGLGISLHLGHERQDGRGRMTYLEKNTAYAEAVIAGQIPAGRLHRLACGRFLRDVAKGKWIWCEKSAAEIVDFCGYLRHYKGEWAGKVWVPEPWQIFILTNIFGWKRADGRRRFRQAYIEVPRKNGKTFLGAAIALFGLTLDMEKGAEVYSVATKKDQAKLLTDDAGRMVGQATSLRAWIKVFSFLRLAKVQRVAPIAHRVEGKGNLDMDTAMAILNNRFQIMAQHLKQLGAVKRSHRRAGVRDRRGRRREHLRDQPAAGAGLPQRRYRQRFRYQVP